MKFELDLDVYCYHCEEPLRWEENTKKANAIDVKECKSCSQMHFDRGTTEFKEEP
jgi:NAD-dependent SIR2 family protein deacetylase